MSLKAKLEAVIYAAEEPVTLAQLAALFAADALEWQAQQEAVSAEQAAEAAFEAAHPLPISSDDLACLPMESDSAAPAQPMPNAAQADAQVAAVQSDASFQPVAEAPSEANPEIVPATGATSDLAALSAEESQPVAPEASPTDDAAVELEARRQARLRDREVRAILRQLLDELTASCDADSRGVEIREIAGGYRMATKPECHDAVLSFVKSLKPALRLSLPALETLAIIAYKQPVTAPEVNEIRGVDTSGVFGSLLARKLISTAGRKQVLGRPILYKTTKEFLLRFGLRDVSELPSMEEFEKLAASELEEPDSSEEDVELKPNPALGPEFDEAASEELEDSPSEGLQAETESSQSALTAETAASN